MPLNLWTHTLRIWPVSSTFQGDLNNTGSARPHVSIELDPEYRYLSLAVAENDDDPVIRNKYRPFLLEKNATIADWIEHLELATVTKVVLEDIQRTNERLKVLILYGSLRQRFVDHFGFLWLVLHPHFYTFWNDSDH